MRVILDTETTGLDPRQDLVVQVALAYRNPETGTVGTWSALCDPGAAGLQSGRMSGAFAINRRTEQELSRAAPSWQTAHALRERLDALVAKHGSVRLYCYNLAFDRAFLSKEPWGLRGPWGPCIMRLAQRRLNPGGMWPKLAEACAKAGIRVEAAQLHDAAFDARASLLLLEVLMSYPRAGSRRIEQSHVQSNGKDIVASNRGV